jgi:hypothetical protein
LAMNIVRMRTLIKAHGHLVMVGDESKAELIEALMNLRKHTYTECAKPYLGTPIDSLLPDISELAERSTRTPSRVRNVDMSGERLLNDSLARSKV